MSRGLLIHGCGAAPPLSEANTKHQNLKFRSFPVFLLPTPSSSSSSSSSVVVVAADNNNVTPLSKTSESIISTSVTISSSSSPQFSRRNALLQTVVSSLVISIPPLSSTRCSPAAALSIGISGPKEWLREQKKKTSNFLLAPIVASRQSLNTAYLLLLKDAPSSEELKEVRRLTTLAFRDCVPYQRSSFVALQSRTGVEVCTFCLIMKNASSLLDNRDLLKLETEATLADLVRLFVSLDDNLDSNDLQVPSNRQKVGEVLMDAIVALNRFEHGVKDCLGI